MDQNEVLIVHRKINKNVKKRIARIEPMKLVHQKIKSKVKKQIAKIDSQICSVGQMGLEQPLSPIQPLSPVILENTTTGLHDKCIHDLLDAWYFIYSKK